MEFAGVLDLEVARFRPHKGHRGFGTESNSRVWA